MRGRPPSGGQRGGQREGFPFSSRVALPGPPLAFGVGGMFLELACGPPSSMAYFLD